MKTAYLLKILILNAFCLSFSLSALAGDNETINATNTNKWTHQVQGFVLFRYEDERFSFRSDRSRLRFIGNLGIVLSNEQWSFQSRLTTGLRDKQNVPAITLVHFSEQPQPDSDIYVDRLFIRYHSSQWGAVTLGKQPWPLKNATDAFWDRHLHPIGVTWQGTSMPLTLSYLKPLDGASSMVGEMFLAQAHLTGQFSPDLTWQLYPWFVSYHGAQAEYATRDTLIDHMSWRLSSWLTFKNFQLGLDLGKNTDAPKEDYGDLSWAIQLTHGELQNVGNAQWHVRVLQTERYGVVTEFAQNAVAGFSTSNIKGFDVRYRYRINPKVWIGTRYSNIKTINQPVKEGQRFRIELGLTL